MDRWRLLMLNLPPAPCPLPHLEESMVAPWGHFPVCHRTDLTVPFSKSWLSIFFNGGHCSGPECGVLGQSQV